MMLNNFFAFVLLIGVVFSCKDAEVSNQPKKEMIVIEANIDWLIGSWVDSTSFKMINQDYVEEWKMITDDKFEGIKYSVKNGKSGDTTNLKIDKTEGKYYYTIGENKEKSTFIQTRISEGEIEFANTKDEFPYNINYNLLDNKLTIIVSGNLNGEQKMIQFNTLKQ